jgi:hypothetical protein
MVKPAVEGTLAQIVAEQVAQTDKEHSVLLQLQESWAVGRFSITTKFRAHCEL